LKGLIMARTAALPILTAEPGLAHYLEEIRRLPMLERQEEYMLAKRWREHGDCGAAHKLVTSHLRLVSKIARDYRGYDLPIAEVISEGNIGLLQAVERFEPEKGFRLATYAVWWIKAAIQEYILRSWSLVKMGTTANQKKLFFNLRKAKSKISALDEGDMRPDQVKLIAKRLGVTETDDRHGPSPRRRCLAQRHDPRGRRFRRVAGLAGGRIPGPGDDARRQRGVR
jgi:RNA polymerase sigma-32 factor